MSETPVIQCPPSPQLPRGPFRGLRAHYALIKDLFETVGRRFDTLGDIYFVPGGEGGLYVSRHPEHIREVLVTHANAYAKTHSAFIRLRRVLGHGLLNTDGEVWRRHRRMIQPAFHKERLRTYSSLMVAETNAMIDTWADGSTIDLDAEFTKLTLRIVSRSLFSHEVDSDVDTITSAVTVLQDSFTRLNVLPSWVPTLRRREARRALHSLNEVMYRLIDARRTTRAAGAGEATLDLLQRLIDAVDEDGSRLSDEEIRDQLVTFFLAGHETTSNALTWTFYLLVEHPDVWAALIEEIEHVTGGRPPQFDDVDALAYTDQVIKESLRIYPPVFAVARKAIADTQIGDYSVPAGSEVALWIYMAHHDPRWFRDPEKFDPLRFTDPAAMQSMKNAYLPFGLGARTCIGKTFATMEATLLLATIAQRYRFSPALGHRVATQPRITLTPKYGMHMVVHER